MALRLQVFSVFGDWSERPSFPYAPDMPEANRERDGRSVVCADTELDIGELLVPERLSPVFQPIFEVEDHSASTYGLEGLTRGPKGSSVETAPVFFERVREAGLEFQADQACTTAILRAATSAPRELRLFVNVHATTLDVDDGFVTHFTTEIDQLGLDPQRFVVEIVEYAPEQLSQQCLLSLKELRRKGIAIAVDDIGSGRSNLRKVLDCNPDYIKIDRHFVANCHRDPNRQAILESIAVLAARSGSRSIAEGVEEPEELHFVTELGIDLVQGFLLARPQPLQALDLSTRALDAIVPRSHESGTEHSMTKTEQR